MNRIKISLKETARAAIEKYRVDNGHRSEAEAIAAIIAKQLDLSLADVYPQWGGKRKKD